MVNVIFVDATGAGFPVDASAGLTLMEAAITHDIPGIVGFCGGMCACGTCHCYPAGQPAAQLPPISENEADTLTRVLERRTTSRLACQIRVDATLEGLVINLPRRQRTP